MQPQPISGRIKPGSRTGFGASRRYIIAGAPSPRSSIQGHSSLDHYSSMNGAMMYPREVCFSLSPYFARNGSVDIFIE
jgi:hypothetical protein